MPEPEGKPKLQIAVIGGGISGLSAAYFLTRRFKDRRVGVSVFEASSRWGGIILSESAGEFLLEGGPDSFVSHKPEALELCRELGLGERLAGSRAEHREACVFSQGKLHPLPAGLLGSPPLNRSALLKSSLLSWKGRLRAALERFIPPSNLEDESVAEFVSRRFGPEVADRLFGPLLRGVYGGDPGQLSIRSVLPHLYQAEPSCRGRSVNGRHSRPLAERPPHLFQPVFISLEGGMRELTEALLQHLQGHAQLHLQAEVRSLMRSETGFRVETAQGASHMAQGVILSTPAWVSSALLSAAAPALASCLSRIPYAPAIVACFGYDEDILADRKGSGFLVPQSENKAMLACTWVNHKFAGRCPGGHALLRCFVGGDQAAQWMSRRDLEISQALRYELKEILRIESRPVLERIYRWPKALPQYVVGHDRNVEQLRGDLRGWPGLYLVGNFLDGIGISDCIRHAKDVSQSVVRYLEDRGKW